MQCERCDNEATVHEVIKLNGQRTELHLCQSCAHATGLIEAMQGIIEQAKAKQSDTETSAGDAFVGSSDSNDSDSGAAQSEKAFSACSVCETTFEAFRNNGFLGCDACYSAFADRLGPMLQRAHEGGVGHIGKRPLWVQEAEAGNGSDAIAREEALAREANRARRVAEVERKLGEAIEREAYDLAATLRDELLTLKSAMHAQPRPQSTDGSDA